MKFTFALSFLAVVLPLLVEAAVVPEFELAARHHSRARGGFGGFGGQGTNKNGAGNTKGQQGQQGQQNQGGQNGAGNANTSTAAAAASTNTSAAAGAASTTTSSAAAASSSAATGQAIVGGGDAQAAQSSTTLDPAVIMKGLASDGQETPEAGQVPSLTSTNNFINFCLTQPNLPLTNGQQVTTGSCNQTPMGVIVASSKMPSAKFTNPKNGDTVASNQAFTISMAISNLQTGNFVNAAANYFSAPAQVDSNGVLIGHSHVVVEQLQALDQTTPTDPTKFVFFKGLNAAAANGVLTADVTAGLPAGVYRLASINTAANHQPALVAVAQHGSLDDAVYFTVSDNGAASNSTGAATGAGSNSSSTATSAATSAAASSTSTTAAGQGQQQGQGTGQQQQGQGQQQGQQQQQQQQGGAKAGGRQGKNGRGRRDMLARLS